MAGGVDNEQKIEIQFGLSSTSCNTVDLLPIYSGGLTSFEIITQKNSGNQAYAFDFSSTYFTQPTASYSMCTVTDWFISTTSLTTTMASSEVEYPYILSVTGVNTDKVQIKTPLAIDGYVQYTVKLWYKIGSGVANKLNPSTALLKFSIGCILAPIAAVVNGHTNPYYDSISATKATFIFPKPTTGTSTVTINLNDVIEFKTNDTYCKPYRLSSFSLSGGVYTLTTASSESRLQINPVVRTANVFTPVLQVLTDSSKNVIASAHFKAETEGIAGANAGTLQYFEF